jgi:hypothetical protein
MKSQGQCGSQTLESVDDIPAGEILARRASGVPTNDMLALLRASRAPRSPSRRIGNTTVPTDTNPPLTITLLNKSS